MFKKVLSLSLILLMFYVRVVHATNTNSIDLECSSSQYLSITDANQTDLDLNSDFSFSVWLKNESMGATKAIITKDDYGNGNRSYALVLDSSQKITLTYFNTISGGSANRTQYITNSSITTSAVWKHVVATADISEATIKIYVDGSSVPVTANNTNATIIGNGAAPFVIGSFFSGGSPAAGTCFDGLLDEVAVYDKVLTQTDVNNLYNSGDGYEMDGDEDGLISGWRFDGETLVDINTTSENDLTNNNSAAYSTDVPFTGGTPPATTRRIYFIN